MNRHLRGFLIDLITLVVIAAMIPIAIWWDRARSRNADLELSGWGGLFLLLAAVAVAAIILAYMLDDHHYWAVTMAIIATAALVLGIAIVAPHIGWLASLRFSGFITGILVALGAQYWLAD